MASIARHNEGAIKLVKLTMFVPLEMLTGTPRTLALKRRTPTFRTFQPSLPSADRCVGFQ